MNLKAIVLVGQVVGVLFFNSLDKTKMTSNNMHERKAHALDIGITFNQSDLLDHERSQGQCDISDTTRHPGLPEIKCFFIIITVQ